MKKIFTLIALAMLTLSVSAQKVIDVDLSKSEVLTDNGDGTYSLAFSYGWEWLNVVNVMEYIDPFEEGGGGFFSASKPFDDEGDGEEDFTIAVPLDVSGCTHLVVEYAEPLTFDINWTVQAYRQVGDWVTAGTIASAYGDNTSVVALSEDEVENIAQICAMSGNTFGTVKIKKIYFTSNAPEEVLTDRDLPLSTFGGTDNGDGTYTFNGGWAWNAKWIGGSWEGYKCVVLKLATPSAGQVKVQIQYKDGVPADTEVTEAVGSTCVVANIDQDAVTNIGQVAILSDEPFTAKRIYLSVDEVTAINDAISDVKAQDSKTYNMAGQRVDASYKGIIVKNGKKYLNK